MPKLPRTKTTYFTIFALSHLTYAAYCYLFGFEYAILTFLLGLTAFNLAAELYMHRTVTHGHFIFSPKIHRVFCALFSMCNFGSLAVNAAMHIDHHRFTDTDKDPNNFRKIGLLNTIAKNWRKEHNPNARQIRKFLRAFALRQQHRNHSFYAVFAMVLFPFIPVVSFWSINLLFIVSHFGNKGMETAVNRRFLFPLMWGAEMHKDHHDHPPRKRMHSYDLIYYSGTLFQSLSQRQGKIV